MPFTITSGPLIVPVITVRGSLLNCKTPPWRLLPLKWKDNSSTPWDVFSWCVISWEDNPPPPSHGKERCLVVTQMGRHSTGWRSNSFLSPIDSSPLEVVVTMEITVTARWGNPVVCVTVKRGGGASSPERYTRVPTVAAKCKSTWSFCDQWCGSGWKLVGKAKRICVSQNKCATMLTQVRVFCCHVLVALWAQVGKCASQTSLRWKEKSLKGAFCHLFNSRFSKPTQDVLTEYTRKVNFLRGLIEAEKMVSWFSLDANSNLCFGENFISLLTKKYRDTEILKRWVGADLHFT